MITIEDPIEFVHPNKKCLVNQREMHSHTESFKRALRAALREDPDIVLIGEMRDLETVRIVLETAETGHLVFATLHTTTAAGTVDRLINQFPTEEQVQVRTSLAETLRGVIAQTLCKKKAGGRVLALEILLGSYALAANIREGKIHQIPMSIQTGPKDGMCFLNDSLLDLVVNGVIGPTGAYQNSFVKDELIKRMATIPNLRSPNGTPWTEEELVKASAGRLGWASPERSALDTGIAVRLISKTRDGQVDRDTLGWVTGEVLTEFGAEVKRTHEASRAIAFSSFSEALMDRNVTHSHFF